MLTAGVRCLLAHQLRRRQPGCCWLCLLGCCAGVLPALPAAQDCLVRTARVWAAIACLLAVGWRRLLLQHLVAVTGVPCLPLVKYLGCSVDPSSSPVCAAPGHVCPCGCACMNCLGGACSLMCGQVCVGGRGSCSCQAVQPTCFFASKHVDCQPCPTGGSAVAGACDATNPAPQCVRINGLWVWFCQGQVVSAWASRVLSPACSGPWCNRVVPPLAMHVCGLLVGASAHDLPGTAAGNRGAGLGSHAAAVLCGGSHGPGQPAPACSGPTAALSCPSWGPGCVCSLCARYVCEGAVHALTGCLQPGDAPAVGCDRAAVKRGWGALRRACGVGCWHYTLRCCHSRRCPAWTQRMSWRQILHTCVPAFGGICPC